MLHCTVFACSWATHPSFCCADDRVGTLGQLGNNNVTGGCYGGGVWGCQWSFTSYYVPTPVAVAQGSQQRFVALSATAAAAAKCVLNTSGHALWWVERGGALCMWLCVIGRMGTELASQKHYHGISAADALHACWACRARSTTTGGPSPSRRRYPASQQVASRRLPPGTRTARWRGARGRRGAGGRWTQWRRCPATAPSMA